MRATNMLVRLKRNLILNDTRYRAGSNGVEIPDTIAGKKVVPYDKRGDVPGTFWVLPRDAEILEGPQENIPIEKDIPVSLGEIAQAGAKPQTFNAAMKAIKK